MKTCFICGPYTTILIPCDCIALESKFNIKRNIEIAIKAAQYLRRTGYNVFCPHVAIAGYCKDMDEMNNQDDKKLINAMCEQWIQICDCIALIPGWEKSDNCHMEYAIADMNGKEIIHLTYGQIGI
jgi:hypothetical protein